MPNSIGEDFIGPRNSGSGCSEKSGISADPDLPDESLSRQPRQADLVGAFSGYESSCPEGIPAEIAILTLLGAFGVTFGILYRAVTVATGGRKRRKKRADFFQNPPPDSVWHEFMNRCSDLYWIGKYIFLAAPSYQI